MTLSDEQIRELISTLSDIFEDYMEESVHPISVASVMLAVAVKQLKRRLDDDEFDAILYELTSNRLSEWENLRTEEEIDEYIMDNGLSKKRTIH
jgi:hypothetical protein